MRTAAWVWIAVAMAATVSGQNTARRSLGGPQTIQQVPCAKGYAWFFPGGQLESCFISHAMDVGDIAVPEGSILHLREDGKPNFLMLARNTRVLGMLCSGGGWLGPAEGAMTGVYPDGKFRYCFLAADQTVQGVPCAAGGIWRAMLGHDAPVQFYEDGKLKSCLLARDFGRQRHWDRFQQAP